MVRTLLAAALAAVPWGFACADDVKIGEPFKGTLEKEHNVSRWPMYVDTFTAFGTELPVKLHEGHKYTFEAKVRGEDRKVSLALVDSSGKILKASGRNTATGSVSITYQEASRTGEFRVVVMSDERGPFTLDSTGPTPTDVTVKALEDDIALLKTVLARKEAALKELRAKKP